MERRSKANNTKSDAKNKKAEDSDTQANSANTLEAKFFAWKKKSKPFKQFPFLDNHLFSEFLNNTPVTANGHDTAHNNTRVKDALKYFNVIKYVEQHSDATELDTILHNVAFLYNVDKEVLKKEVLPIKKSIKKAPKNMAIEQYLKQLLEKDPPKIDIIKDDAPEVIDLSSPKSKPAATGSKKSRTKSQNGHGTGVDLKEISNVEDLTLIKKNGRSNRKAKNGDAARTEEVAQRHADETLPVKKKQKDNNSKGNDVIIIIEQSEKEKRMNGKSKSDKEKKKAEKKEKSSKKDSENGEVKSKSKSDEPDGKKKSRSKKVEEKAISSDDEEEIKQQGPEQYMELHINNDVDEDDGEGFSFFYVNDNVHNKTKPYFEKKIRPEQICSCVGGCNDPTICACARFNFENCGKTTCYVYDSKYGKKRLLNPLLRKDMHIYECSSQCACTKSQCLNSCINEGTANRTDVNSFVVERYKKDYKGLNPKLQECSATMWGLRSKDFIPANTYVVEYCGEIITKKEGDRRGEKYDSVNCNYLFDLNKHAEIEKIDHSNNTIILNIDGVCETRNISKLKDIAENFPLVIDAFFYGNHSRFVNHSCEPNMVALAVHTENRNILLPRIIFFALRDIQPGEELTIDYNCAPLKDLKNTDQMVCLCGAAQCRGYVYEEAKETD